ncbi:MAG TPA: hypothetical protein VND96_12410 [Candidatus Micrarchaeaceae archaeon]|nr:hypothetical protein [Candidatus Micrarchaeaceae archaeon]
MPWERAKPDIEALLGLLDRHGVRYVVTGSVAARLYGVPLEPGDLDVTPASDRENLDRLAAALEEVGADLDPEEPFGRWENGDDGERRWLAFEPTALERKAREEWRPRPDDPASFDHLVRTRFGALDVVPEIAGSYDDLRRRATAIEVKGRSVWIESIEDQLATLTIPLRPKDADRVRALRAIHRGYAHS